MLDEITSLSIDPTQLKSVQKTDPSKNPKSQPDFKSFLETAEAKENPNSEALPVEQAKTAVNEFREYIDKKPEELMREMILGEMGLTEEKLAALPHDERAKIEERIKEKIEERIKIDHAHKKQDG